MRRVGEFLVGRFAAASNDREEYERLNLVDPFPDLLGEFLDNTNGGVEDRIGWVWDDGAIRVSEVFCFNTYGPGLVRVETVTGRGFTFRADFETTVELLG